jgi:hypothetical protein
LIALGVVIALVVIGYVGGQSGGTESPAAAASETEGPTTAVEATPTPRPTPTPTPTPAPPTGPNSAAIGETVRITCGGTDCLDITVTDPSFNAQYYDPDGFYNDLPEVAGNVFLQVYVTYLALDDSASYNPFDWDVYVGGVQVPNYTFVLHGPEPTLGSGQLAAGRSAAGWLVYEVAPAGTVLLSYAPNFDGPPIFEVTLRP